MVGTLPYMAPEQITGADTDVRTDIFAFGVVFYEMLTGRRPYPDQNPAELNTAVFDCEPTPIAMSVPAMPLGLDRLISTCMARDPDDRFQSAHDLLLQLRWAATPTSDIVVAQHRARATRRWQFAALAAIVALAGTAIVGGRILLGRSVRRTPETVTRFSYAMPLDQNFTRAGRRPLAISPRRYSVGIRRESSAVPETRRRTDGGADSRIQRRPVRRDFLAGRTVAAVLVGRLRRAAQDCRRWRRLDARRKDVEPVGNVLVRRSSLRQPGHNAASSNSRSRAEHGGRRSRRDRTRTCSARNFSPTATR